MTMFHNLTKRIGRELWYRRRAIGWWLRGRLSERVTVKTPQGRITVSSRDQVLGKGIYFLRHHEYDLTTRVTGLLRQLYPDRFRGQGTVLDVGANVGVIGIGLVLGGSFARCVSVEPEPLNFSLLTHNVRQNGLADRFACVQQAAAEVEGELTFELSETNFGDHRVRSGEAGGAPGAYGEAGRSVIRVPAKPLDRIVAELPAGFADRIELVWIDVQGHEAGAFRGGEKLFARGVPTVAEVWPYGLGRAGTSVEEYVGLVSRYWQRYYDLDAPAAEPRPVAVLPELLTSLGAEGDYHNVLLTP